MCSRLFWPGKSVTSAGLGKTSTKLCCCCCRAITGRCMNPDASNRFTNVRMRPPSWNAGLDRLAGYGAASQGQNTSVSCRSTGRHLPVFRTTKGASIATTAPSGESRPAKSQISSFVRRFARALSTVPAALIIATPVGLFSPQARSIPTNFNYPGFGRSFRES